MSGVIGEDGSCLVSVGPTLLSHEWTIAWATVQSASLAPTLAFISSLGGLLGGTRSGNQDTTDLPNVHLSAGQRVEALWRNGTPGAAVILSVYGTIEIKGR